MTLTDAGLTDLETAAVIAVDVPYGSDINAESGLDRSIGDSKLTGRPLPELYKNALAKQIIKLSKSKKDYSLQAKQWMQENEPAHKALMEFKDAAHETSGYQGKYLQNLANTLEVLWQIKEAELGLRSESPFYRDVVKTCVGAELESVDIKFARDDLIKNLMTAGFDPDKYHGNVRDAVAAWESNQGILSGEEMKNEILRLIPLLTKKTRKNVLPNFPYFVRQLPLEDFQVSYITGPNIRFMASNNYRGDRKPYESGFEFTDRLKLPPSRIETLVGHEANPGHHLNALSKHVQIRTGLLSSVAGVNTMCTPECALNEGIANSRTHIFYGKNANRYLNINQRIALILDTLDHMGRANSVVKKFQDGKSTEDIKTYLVQECCLTPEMADTINIRLGIPPINLAYLYGYHSGTEVVQYVLKNYERKEALRTLYSFNGPVDAITLLDMAKEFCTPI